MSIVAGARPVARRVFGDIPGEEGGRAFTLRCMASIGITLLVSMLLVFAIELIARGSFEQTLLFFSQPFRPSWTTVAVFSLLIVFFDALIGRAYHALFLLAPPALLLAFVGHQKTYYLGDPLYPTDFLYTRQIVELMPLLARQRPWEAVAMGAGGIIAIASLLAMWRYGRRRSRPLSWRARSWRVALALPALVFFASMLDYATFSWVRDRLQIIPIMWDQKENYNSNGFAIAFALNVPMAKVVAPEGYSKEAIDAMVSGPTVPVSAPAERPDIIVLMSESFWDPTQLPNIAITPNPVPVTQDLKRGHIFSPEFGGMTANVEFEALTGFSNAFLPTGSIPYQQYIRSQTPSLAKFFNAEGYATRAIHPFGGWFWNRTMVYDSFGFQRFMSEENLPHMDKRGPLASDTALTDEIMREADAMTAPFFFFAVSLQNHGPYEPFRYFNNNHAIDGDLTEWSRNSLQTYAEGAADADRNLGRLIEWASKRDRETIIAFFGDHLPPLGSVYVETGFMKEPVADRMAPPAQMRMQHETPLVLWSNRRGPIETGTISPSFLPLQVLRVAGFTHPYYTGVLGQVFDQYPVVDRNMLIGARGEAIPNWSRQKQVDPDINNLRLLQYDIIFGDKHGAERFFPDAKPAPVLF